MVLISLDVYVFLLPRVECKVLLDPPDEDAFLGVVATDRAAGHVKVLHLLQGLPQGHHLLLADLHHHAVLHDAGLGGQPGGRLEGTAKHYETCSRDWEGK